MADLYKGKIPIIRSDLNEGFIRSAVPDPEHRSTGAVPRDFTVDPVEMRDSPSKMVLYDPSEWDALYDAGEVNEDSLEHLYLRGDKPAFDLLDQNGFSDCWCHSTAHSIMMDAVKQNVPVTRLNAVAAATLMGRTDGGWAGLSMKFAREKGFPPIGPLAPYQSRRVQNTAELQAQMKLHRNLEDWYDLSKAEYDQTETKTQLATALFNNLPSPSDYNRLSHSMLSLRWVRIEKGSWGILTLNSWAQFGYYGLCVLAEMVPDGAVSLRSSTPNAA